MMHQKSTKLGQQGEILTCNYLQRHGFVIIQRNYRASYGEIDVIAIKKELIVFVEVKTRAKKQLDLSTAITYAKQQKIIKTAKYFMSSQQSLNYNYRFDVALLEPDNNQELHITYISDAFRAE